MYNFVLFIPELLYLTHYYFNNNKIFKIKI